MKPGASKKATIVYHDQSSAGVLPQIASSLDDRTSVVEKQLKNPRHHKSQPYLKAEQPVLRRTQSKHFKASEKLFSIDDDDVTEAAYEDAVEQLSEDIDLPPQKYSSESDRPVSISRADIAPGNCPRKSYGRMFLDRSTFSKTKKKFDARDLWHIQ